MHKNSDGAGLPQVGLFCLPVGSCPYNKACCKDFYHTALEHKS